MRAKPKGLDQPNGDGAYDRGSNVARLGVDAGERESLFAERREFGNTLGERKVESAWPGKATGGDTVNATISTFWWGQVCVLCACSYCGSVSEKGTASSAHN